MKATNVRAFNVLALPLMALAVLALVLAFGFGGAERAVAQTQNENGTSFVMSGSLDVKPIGLCELNGEVFIKTEPVFGTEVGELYFDSQNNNGIGKITVKCPELDPQTFQVSLLGNCTEKNGTEATNAKVNPPFNCNAKVTAEGFCGTIGEGESCNANLDLECPEVTTPDLLECVISPSKVLSKESAGALQINGGNITLTSNGVGGIVTDLAPEQPALPLETAQSSGTNAGLLAGIAAGISAAVVAVTGAAWYARRRLIS